MSVHEVSSSLKEGGEGGQKTHDVGLASLEDLLGLWAVRDEADRRDGDLLLVAERSADLLGKGDLRATEESEGQVTHRETSETRERQTW